MTSMMKINPEDFDKIVTYLTENTQGEIVIPKIYGLFIGNK